MIQPDPFRHCHVLIMIFPPSSLLRLLTRSWGMTHTPPSGEFGGTLGAGIFGHGLFFRTVSPSFQRASNNVDAAPSCSIPRLSAEITSPPCCLLSASQDPIAPFGAAACSESSVLSRVPDLWGALPRSLCTARRYPVAFSGIKTLGVG